MAGRPPKLTVDYFSHDCNHGKTIFVLESRYGNDGYAFWFKLLETLGSTEGHFYDCRNMPGREFLAAKTRLEWEMCSQILDLLASLDAIDKELWSIGVIWCDKFTARISAAYRKRSYKLPLKPTMESISGVLNSFQNEYPAETNGKGKERKDSKEKIYSQIFECWLKNGLQKHKKLTDKMKTKIRSVMKDGFTEQDICAAIENYSTVLKSPQKYFFTYSWPLEHFLSRGLNDFVAEANPLTKFLKNGQKPITEPIWVSCPNGCGPYNKVEQAECPKCLQRKLT